jgi:hypothetical protein
LAEEDASQLEVLFPHALNGYPHFIGALGVSLTNPDLHLACQPLDGYLFLYLAANRVSGVSTIDQLDKRVDANQV